MIFRKPILSTYRPPQTPVREAVSEMFQIKKLVEELQRTKLSLEQKLAEFGDKSNAELEKASRELNSLIARVQNEVEAINRKVRVQRTVMKGDKGDKPIAGVDYQIPKDAPRVDEEALAQRIVSKLRKDLSIDYEKLAKEAAKYVKPADVNHGELAGMVLGKIQKDKLLKMEHIGNFTEGMEQTLSPIRHLAAGFRGGGDTVDAGTGISITTVNGKKVISSSATAISILTATGTIDDSNTTFTFASEPTAVVVNGATYRDGHGCTISGTTVTLDNPAGTGGDIYGLV